MSCSSALRLAARVIELYDDATMKDDYMLDSSDCAGILDALAGYFELEDARRAAEREALLARVQAAETELASLREPGISVPVLRGSPTGRLGNTQPEFQFLQVSASPLRRTAFGEHESAASLDAQDFSAIEARLLAAGRPDER